mmetsp:Transcript_16851/g.18994  ORF Transcript_16851/g.18994 Transcript_16851/m.18994 type:complete len:110 (+) Transcript_16851:30-359(+)
MMRVRMQRVNKIPEVLDIHGVPSPDHVFLRQQHVNPRNEELDQHYQEVYEVVVRPIQIRPIILGPFCHNKIKIHTNQQPDQKTRKRLVQSIYYAPMLLLLNESTVDSSL